MINLLDPDQRAAAAAEYVLGTLEADDHAAVAAALARDADLQAQVYAWQDRLLGLSARAAPVEPGEAAWQRIERALDRSGGGATAGASLRGAVAAGEAAPGGRPARGPDDAAQAAPAAPWWQGLRLWQGVSALAVAASLVLAVALALRTPAPQGPRYLAVLQSPDLQSTGWIVEVQAGGRLRLVPAAATAAPPAGRSLQFWTKPEGAAAPTSLGLVQAGQPVDLPASRLPAVGARQLFEITLEPEGGSPIGRPTGPILYVGRTVAM